MRRLYGRCRRDPRSTAAIGEPRSARLAIESLGDDHGAARIRLPASSDALKIDVVFVRIGRALQVLVFADTAAPFPGALRERLTAKAVDRLRSTSTADGTAA